MIKLLFFKDNDYIGYGSAEVLLPANRNTEAAIAEYANRSHFPAAQYLVVALYSDGTFSRFELSAKAPSSMSYSVRRAS